MGYVQSSVHRHARVPKLQKQTTQVNGQQQFHHASWDAILRVDLECENITPHATRFNPNRQIYSFMKYCGFTTDYENSQGCCFKFIALVSSDKSKLGNREASLEQFSQQNTGYTRLRAEQAGQ